MSSEALNHIRFTPDEFADSLTLREVQDGQRQYDEVFWQHQGPPNLIKIRHILLHLMETTGRVATWVEAAEHGGSEPATDILANKVTPDLLFHAAQLANVLNVDLGAVYVTRIDNNATKRESALQNPN